MRTIAQILDELGNCEYERMEISRLEAQLEAELVEVEDGLGWQEVDRQMDAYYKEQTE